ncbi:MAG: ssl1498 family light-harvesting-like protein [Cyanobacteria bacterium P01_F01_bin.143]
MYTVQEENGRLNNYAVEPTVYVAEYPESYEKRRYMIQGVIAALIVTAAIVTSFLVS